MNKSENVLVQPKDYSLLFAMIFFTLITLFSS